MRRVAWRLDRNAAEIGIFRQRSFRSEILERGKNQPAEIGKKYWSCCVRHTEA